MKKKQRNIDKGTGSVVHFEDWSNDPRNKDVLDEFESQALAPLIQALREFSTYFLQKIEHAEDLADFLARKMKPLVNDGEGESQRSPH